MEKILFATDGSTSANAAMDMVNHLLTAWPNASLTVLYVTSMPLPGEESISDDFMSVEAHKATELEGLARTEWFKDDGHRVRSHHAHGPTAITIATVGEEIGADVIVVGCHGTGDVDRLLLGSVSHGVVYCSRIPVLVVRDWKGATHAGRR